jgi:hypothetical protein
LREYACSPIVADIALVLHEDVSKSAEGEEMVIPSRPSANTPTSGRDGVTSVVRMVGKKGIRKRKETLQGKMVVVECD